MDKNKIRRLAHYLQDSGESFDVSAERELLELWNDCEGAAAPTPEMAERLNRSIRSRKAHAAAGLLAKWGAAAAMVACIFAAGFHLAPFREGQDPAEPQKFVVVTAKGSVGNYVLPDGTDVWLNESSRLEYQSDFAENRNATLVGEGYFEVHRDTLHPFTLSMEHLQVEVLGTSFDARGYGNGAPEDVVLRKGKVKVEAVDGSLSAIMQPNERIIYKPSNHKLVRREVEAINYCRWMEDTLIFSNMPLADIVTNIERRYNVEIKVSPELNANRRLSLTVGHDALEDVLAVVNALTHTRTKYEADGTILLTSNRR